MGYPGGPEIKNMLRWVMKIDFSSHANLHEPNAFSFAGLKSAVANMLLKIGYRKI